jgi:hypothetical protein
MVWRYTTYEVQHSTISSLSSASHVFPYLPTNLRPQPHPIISPHSRRTPKNPHSHSRPRKKT